MLAVNDMIRRISPRLDNHMSFRPPTRLDFNSVKLA